MVEKLTELVAKTGLRPYDLLRRNEAKAKELGLTKETGDEKLLALMVKFPELMQRPIIEIGEKAVVGRPIDNALKFIREQI